MKPVNFRMLALGLQDLGSVPTEARVKFTFNILFIHIKMHNFCVYILLFSLFFWGGDLQIALYSVFSKYNVKPKFPCHSNHIHTPDASFDATAVSLRMLQFMTMHVLHN